MILNKFFLGNVLEESLVGRRRKELEKCYLLGGKGQMDV